MAYTLIGEPNFVKYFKKSVQKQYVIDTNIETYDNAIIVNEHKHGFGVFDKDFHFVKSSCQIRKNKGQFIPKFNHENIPYVDEDVVFIGNVYPHFGHFLLEHMNRLYALLYKEHKNKKVVLINNKGVENIPKYMFDLIEIFGVKCDNIIILDKTVRFKSVCVPKQSFNTRVYTSSSFARTFDRMAQNVPDEEIYDKIYVSRTQLNDAHKTLGEEKVQSVFAKNGFKVIYPEKLPLQSQIALIKNCKILAGCAGTALHLALFMKKGGTVISIKRNRRPACNAMIQNNVNNTKQLDGVFISGSVELHKTFHSTQAPQIIGINKYLRQFFQDNKYKLSDDDLEFDETAMNEYINAYKEYKLQHGGVFAKEVKRYFIKYTALLIPGRERRGRWRAFWKKKLN